MLRVLKRFRRKSRRGPVRALWHAAALFLLVGSVYFPFVYTHNTTSGAIGVAPWFAVVAFGITSWVAAVSRQPLVTGDIVRILSWAGFAFGLGLRQSAGAYFAFYHPQYAAFWQSIGLAIICMAAFAYVLSLMFSPPRRRWRKGECPTCGYGSQHLISNRCPECGRQYQKPTKDDAA